VIYSGRSLYKLVFSHHSCISTRDIQQRSTDIAAQSRDRKIFDRQLSTKISGHSVECWFQTHTQSQNHRSEAKPSTITTSQAQFSNSYQNALLNPRPRPSPTLTLADFHIDNLRNTVVNSPGGQSSWTSVVACPSNYWNCKCLTSGDRTGKVDGTLGDSVFSIKSGFCGMGKLNFYKSGNTFLMYKDGGDGKVIGTCYWNTGDAGKVCGITGGSTTVTGGYVCYSYVCN
jgi:hypothetical protein